MGMKKILILDDTQHDLGELQALLEDHGYNFAEMSERGCQVMQALQRTEQRYQDLFENAPIGIFRSSLDAKFLSANPAVAKILKYASAKEMIGAVNRTNIVEAVYLEPDRRPEIVATVLADGEWHAFEERFRCKDDSIVTCDFYLRAIFEGSNCIELNGFIENVTERKQAEDSLRLIKCCVDHAYMSIFLVSPIDLKILYANDYMCRDLGYAREEITSMAICDLDPLLMEEMVVQLDRQFTSNGFIRPFEAYQRRKNGTLVPVEITVNRIKFDGEDLVICFAQDISACRRAEDQLKASLAEKEVLLKEVHHRVKNNLQVVSSLLHLQSKKIFDPAMAAHFIESQNRIYSMALAHEQLYQSKNLAEVRLPAYVTTLVEQIEQVFRIGEKPAFCRVDVDDIVLDIEQVIPCGLLITELLSNALRHAFPGDLSGRVDVEIHRHNGSLRLMVRDNGTGLPDDLDLSTVKTLGLQLVGALADQLDGKLELQRVDGTSFQVIFPIRTLEGVYSS